MKRSGNAADDDILIYLCWCAVRVFPCSLPGTAAEKGEGAFCAFSLVWIYVWTVKKQLFSICCLMMAVRHLPDKGQRSLFFQVRRKSALIAYDREGSDRLRSYKTGSFPFSKNYRRSARSLHNPLLKTALNAWHKLALTWFHPYHCHLHHNRIQVLPFHRYHRCIACLYLYPLLIEQQERLAFVPHPVHRVLLKNPLLFLRSHLQKLSVLSIFLIESDYI